MLCNDLMSTGMEQSHIRWKQLAILHMIAKTIIVVSTPWGRTSDLGHVQRFRVSAVHHDHISTQVVLQLQHEGVLLLSLGAGVAFNV